MECGTSLCDARRSPPLSLFTESSSLSYLWGRNDAGQLGDGTTKDHSHPHRLHLPVSVVQLSCGDRHALALANTGIVYAWGAPDASQPRPVTAVNGQSVIAISASGEWSVALTLGGQVLAWSSSKAPTETVTVASGFASAVAGVHTSGGTIVALMTNGHMAIAQAPAFVAKVHIHVTQRYSGLTRCF